MLLVVYVGFLLGKSGFTLIKLLVVELIRHFNGCCEETHFIQKPRGALSLKFHAHKKNPRPRSGVWDI